MPRTRRDEIKERFLAYHKSNPDVWKLFRKYTFELISAGNKRGSADAVLHRIRWHHKIRITETDGFKINDHYSAWYSRAFEKKFPKHAGFFKRRRQPSADKDPTGSNITFSDVNKPDPKPVGITDEDIDGI